MDVRYRCKYFDHFAEHGLTPRAYSFAGKRNYTKRGNRQRGSVAYGHNSGTPIRRCLRNAVVLVMEDKEIDINLGTKGHYLIEGIFGYPLISALSSFTVFDDRVEIAAASSLS